MSDTERDQVADLLDELVQVFEEGTPGGHKRSLTRDRIQGATWETRWPVLEREARDVLRRLRQRNQRAASRRRQAPKTRGVLKTMK